MSELNHESGVCIHLVCKDITAYQELLDLLARWRKSPNTMYIDWEQSLDSYRQERGDA